MLDPNYRTIFQTDYSWLIEDGKGEATLIIAQEDEDARKFYVYSFDVDRVSFAPSKYPEWFVKHLSDVASSAGTTVRELRADLSSKDPSRRARAYEDIGGHFGFDNFDSYPLVMGYKEFEHYWSNEAGEPEPEEEEE